MGLDIWERALIRGGKGVNQELGNPNGYSQLMTTNERSGLCLTPPKDPTWSTSDVMFVDEQCDNELIG